MPLLDSLNRPSGVARSPATTVPAPSVSQDSQDVEGNSIAALAEGTEPGQTTDGSEDEELETPGGYWEESVTSNSSASSTASTSQPSQSGTSRGDKRVTGPFSYGQARLEQIGDQVYLKGFGTGISSNTNTAALPPAQAANSRQSGRTATARTRARVVKTEDEIYCEGLNPPSDDKTTPEFDCPSEFDVRSPCQYRVASTRKRCGRKKTRLRKYGTAR